MIVPPGGRTIVKDCQSQQARRADVVFVAAGEDNRKAARRQIPGGDDRPGKPFGSPGLSLFLTALARAAVTRPAPFREELKSRSGVRNATEGVPYGASLPDSQFLVADIDAKSRLLVIKPLIGLPATHVAGAIGH